MSGRILKATGRGLILLLIVLALAGCGKNRVTDSRYNWRQGRFSQTRRCVIAF